MHDHVGHREVLWVGDLEFVEAVFVHFKAHDEVLDVLKIIIVSDLSCLKDFALHFNLDFLQVG